MPLPVRDADAPFFTLRVARLQSSLPDADTGTVTICSFGSLEGWIAMCHSGLPPQNPHAQACIEVFTFF